MVLIIRYSLSIRFIYRVKNNTVCTNSQANRQTGINRLVSNQLLSSDTFKQKMTKLILFN